MSKVDIDNSRHTMVKLSEIRIDRNYQRELQNTRLRIKDQFDPNGVSTLYLGQRKDKSLWCIDGQQRLWVLRELGYVEWNCWIIPSSGPVHEARIYDIINGRNRKSLTPYENYKALLAAQDETAESVESLCKSLGCRVWGGTAEQWNDIRWVKALYQAVKKEGVEDVRRCLKLVMETWPKQPAACLVNIPTATLELIICNREVFDDDHYRSALETLPPQKILNDSSLLGGRERRRQVMRQLAKNYNKGLPNGRRLYVARMDEE